MRTANNLTVTNLTHLAFHINAVIDSGANVDLSYRDIYDATDIGCLLERLEKRLHDRADLSLLTSLEPDHILAIEKALQNAAAALRGREMKKAHVEKSGLCLLMAIILEALQQNFSPSNYPPEPEPEPVTPESRN